MTKNNRTTIDDVAAAAGVSKRTVSRVINEQGEISEATRTKVQAVIKQLDYHPSRIARGLNTNKTYTIGFMVLDITNPFFAIIEQSAEVAAWEQGYNLVLFNIGSNMARQQAGFRFFQDTQVDGVVVCSSYLPDDELFALLAPFNATVLLNREATPEIAGMVRVDNETGMTQAVRHLIAGRRRNIAFIGGPEASPVSKERETGYRQAFAEAGMPVRPELMREVTFGQPWRDGYTIASEMLDAYPQIDAIQCYNDLIASGALRAVMEQGRRVPDDVAIIGCDDILLASLLTPSLTTLRSDLEGIGEALVNLLLKRINGTTDASDNVVFHQELIMRESAP